MRPRVFPAENLERIRVSDRVRHRCFNEAAGIPRGKPWLAVRYNLSSSKASMRLRVFPAENETEVVRGDLLALELQ